MLSSSKELVLFQCMSHLALMLYLWLRGWALARTQDAVQPIDCPGTERERDKSRAIVDWERWWVTDTQKEKGRDAKAEEEQKAFFFSYFCFWAQFKILWRGGCSEPQQRPACVLMHVCFWVSVPKWERWWSQLDSDWSQNHYPSKAIIPLDSTPHANTFTTNKKDTTHISGSSSAASGMPRTDWWLIVGAGPPSVCQLSSATILSTARPQLSSMSAAEMMMHNKWSLQRNAFLCSKVPEAAPH